MKSITVINDQVCNNPIANLPQVLQDGSRNFFAPLLRSRANKWGQSLAWAISDTRRASDRQREFAAALNTLQLAEGVLFADISGLRRP